MCEQALFKVNRKSTYRHYSVGSGRPWESGEASVAWLLLFPLTIVSLYLRDSFTPLFSLFLSLAESVEKPPNLERPKQAEHLHKRKVPENIGEDAKLQKNNLNKGRATGLT